ncbi:phosphate ABC transporter substrate-binding protein PstS [Stenotrophomonas indicatrix]|jgi:phosphate transport system substrate-binding protein|uniref:Phosphate-binding protein PstS n=1 Tax=Stenotrophomonas indicatrix TaxID=2045451 RepID=A0A1W1GXK1_9GAMM|nr:MULTISPECIES: phosphate ABC transporter substrate-binding protein PstS [Stenotrophomonas]EVT71874.1 phosphate-binding protein [Stenotrophomonas maltophilia 5BA-I-2]MBN5049117.1 phosphate ABC transporter substrate-binding protein PstS [Stenotrophomonas maltophilia]OUL10757.1 phosphate ABC transporter substrate-binding protein PstS [bacterium AM6]AVJ32628.1 phosphate ABC transporter substrate-binding protein PstS [Stenotrophomonas sp. MYb57]EZP46282.1 Phosphate-binding protein PstS [Stenotrop
MKLHSASLAALSLAIALGLSACGGDKQAAQQPAADGAAAPAAAGDKVTAEVSGAGASFIFPLVSKWSADYNTATGAKINYQSIGSGGGIAQIKAGTVDFGSSDKPLSSDELAQAGLAQFPSAIGGVVPVVNIDGLEAGKLRLSGALLADIFLGKVKTWNDPAIVAANPGVTLPDGKITIVHRSDGSGTTFNFSNYLSKVSPEWKSKVGEGTSVQWPDGVGGKGNEGVASYVKQIKGSIGYVELAYALQNAMPYTSLQNAAGTWVQPNAETFAAAAASADWASAKDFNLVITNAPGEQAWPITATNFMLMQKKPKDAKRNQDALAFFKWAFESGQTQANELHYVPLPAELVKQIEAYWATELK